MTTYSLDQLLIPGIEMEDVIELGPDDEVIRPGRPRPILRGPGVFRVWRTGQSVGWGIGPGMQVQWPDFL